MNYVYENKILFNINEHPVNLHTYNSFNQTTTELLELFNISSANYFNANWIKLF